MRDKANRLHAHSSSSIIISVEFCCKLSFQSRALVILLLAAAQNLGFTCLFMMKSDCSSYELN